MGYITFTKQVIYLIAPLAFLFITNTVSAQNSSAYKGGIIFEKYSGTENGDSPLGEWAVDSLQKRYGDNLIVLSWHGPNNSEPLWIQNQDTLFTYFCKNGWPIGYLNRSVSSAFGFPPPPTEDAPIWTPDFLHPLLIPNALKKASIIDFRIVNAAYDPNIRQVDFDVDVTPMNPAQMPSDDTTSYSTVGVLTEDSVLETQAYSGGWDLIPGGDISNFPEMNVVRVVEGGALWGNKFLIGTHNPIQTYPIRTHYSMKLKDSWNPAMIQAKSFCQDVTGITTATFDIIGARKTVYLTSLPASAPPGIWVVLPNANSIVTPGIPTNIVWGTGGNISGNVKLEYSQDSGATWNLIVASVKRSPYTAWTIPTSAYGKLVEIRASDIGNPATFGISEKFKTPGIIDILTPAAGEIITGGTTGYDITIRTGNLKALISLYLSTDNGQTWDIIGNMENDTATQYPNWNVPDPSADLTNCLIKAVDINGILGTSGIFTIKSRYGGNGAITNLILVGWTHSKYQIDNGRNLGVEWSLVTGGVGSGIDVYFSTDDGIDWLKKDTISLAFDKTNFTFQVPKTGSYPNCTIKVQSSSDPTIYAIWRDSNVTTFTVGQSLGVDENLANDRYSISNYPNPFATETSIKFTLPIRTYVTIKVLDNLGREVNHLVTETLDAGEHVVPFSSTNLANGVYTYTLEGGATKLVGKMSIVK